VNPSSSSVYLPYVALVGSPNSGKTSLFNILTGSRQKVGNYPGVTVERKEGQFKTAQGKILRILDLPGTYSMQAATPDEAVTREVLLGGPLEESPPTLLVAVADATNLERGLNFVLELKELGIPTLLALNMMDLAQGRGLKVDLEVLSRELGMPVIPVIATRKKSALQLRQEIERQVENLSGLESPDKVQDIVEGLVTPSPKEKLKARYQKIDEILKAAHLKNLKPARWTERIDRVVLHPVYGTLLLYLILALIFQAIFNWAIYPMEFLEGILAGFGNQLGEFIPQGWLHSLVIDGVISGVGAVVVFLPQILFLFFIILLLEDSGYMARAAFLMDRHMRRAGLHGRAFIPLLSSFACAIPGIMAARTIENRRDRMTTILISPLMACSARVPVYTLLIAAFIPNKPVWGPFRLQGLVMLGLYLVGALVAFWAAFVIRKIFFRGPDPVFMMELPTYKWPNLRNVIHGMWNRAKLFLKRAGTIILAASILIWFLSSYPKPPENIPQGRSPISYSFAGGLGRALEPVIRPLGFDGTIGVALVTGVVAREVIVSSLATLYSVENGGEGEEGLKGLAQLIQKRWNLATGLSLLVFFIFAMQCLSTLAVVRRETNSWRWPAFMFLYLSLLAYGASFVTYHLVRIGTA